jgi:long-chain acyl-CoA synthetase
MSTAKINPPQVTLDANSGDVAAHIDRLIAGRTIPAEFLSTARSRRDEIALRWGEGTTWNEMTWATYLERVARVAGGLATLGVGPGDRIVLLLPNCPEFHIIDLAIMSIGATPISLYATASSEQIDHIVKDSGAFLAIAFDDDAVERLWSSGVVRELNMQIVIERPSDTTTRHIDLAQLESSDPVDLADRIAKIDPNSEATVIYTSGTTGPPKGVMLSHRNILWATESLRLALGDKDLSGKRIVSYLPMAHIAERSTSHYSAVSSGYEVTTCSDARQLAEQLEKVRPHLLFGVPRIWEKMCAGVEQILNADPQRRASFDDAIKSATDIRARITLGTATADDIATLEFLDAIAFAPVREALGLNKLEIAVSGAAPIPVDTIEWFRAIGIPLTEIYGMSESAGPIAWTSSLVKAGTIGPAIPGSEIRLAEDGEILFRGGNVFVGYLGLEEATAETIDTDGWLHTGDVGELDAEGNLRVVDRKKELIVTSGGKNISPANLEAAVRTVPLIAQACVVGDGRPYVAALITLDRESIAQWAERRHLAVVDPFRLSEQPELIAEVEDAVDNVMEQFSNPERVKRILILPDEWTVDSALLTPTLKLRRKQIIEHYASEIKILFANNPSDKNNGSAL